MIRSAYRADPQYLSEPFAISPTLLGRTARSILHPPSANIIDLNSPLLGPFLPVLENALVLRGQLLVFPFIEDCGSLLLHQFKIPIQL